MELLASPPTVAPSPPQSPDRGGIVFMRKELNSTRQQVRKLIGSVESLNMQLTEAHGLIERLRAENADLRRRGPADLRTRSAPVGHAEAQVGQWGVRIDLNTERMDPVAILGPELSAVIFLLVRVDRITSLHRWCRVSATWNSALKDDALWRPLCESTWSSWRWPQLPASEQAPEGCGRDRGMWRQWFTDAHWSASELGITTEELVAITWRFEFKDDQSGLKEATAQFFADGTFVSTVPFAPSGRRPLPYRLCNEPVQSANIGVDSSEPQDRQSVALEAELRASPACKFVQGAVCALRPCCCCQHHWSTAGGDHTHPAIRCFAGAHSQNECLVCVTSLSSQSNVTRGWLYRGLAGAGGLRTTW